MSLIPKLPKRDFWVIILSLAGITLLAWLYLFSLASQMSLPTSGMPAISIPVWDTHYFLMMFLMWAIMMVGMMVPSAAPTVLIFAAVGRKSSTEGGSPPPVSLFVIGYIVIWSLFSLAATSAQWGLDRAALLSPMMVSKSPSLGAGLLIAAGIYQWLPIKDRCLEHCRSPMEFIARHWKPGPGGAFRMGLIHGAYCLGCCWALMTLLFVGGVMNLLWIAVITIFVLLEKLVPAGRIGGHIAGGLMVIAGSVLIWAGI